MTDKTRLRSRFFFFTGNRFIVMMRLIHLIKSLIIPAITVITSLSLLSFVFRPRLDSLYEYQPVHRFSKHDPLRSIYNSTLGFEKIFYINLPQSYDRDDALLMQGLVTGLTMEGVDTANADEISSDGSGLPPSSRDKHIEPMRPAHKACARSHANSWKKMLREGWNSVLVLEGDAAWDRNIKGITHRAAEAFYEFKLQLDENSATKPSFHDPYGTKDWDVLSFSTCTNTELNSNTSMTYHDPDAPVGYNYFGTELNMKRIVRKSGDLICLTGYAITRKAALKMLLRLNLDLDQPVDVMLSNMIEKGDLNVYNLFPRIICQWSYKEGIGAEKLSSTIDDHGKASGVKDSPSSEHIWKQIHSERNVWQMRGDPNEIKFPALAEINNVAYQ